MRACGAQVSAASEAVQETVLLETTHRVLEGRQHIVYGQMRIDGDLEPRGPLIVGEQDNPGKITPLAPPPKTPAMS